MYDFLKKFDGKGRPPRDVQVQALEWLAKGWASLIDVISAPVASGKSSIARAIQIATGAHIITPSNILVNQYSEDFPEVNMLKGKSHYRCHSSGLSCQDWMDTLEQKACANCPYVECKTRALEGEPTFFNPMSLYYASRTKGYTAPKVVIVDEAHQLQSMLLMLCGVRFRHSVYKFDERCNNEVYLTKWMGEQGEKLRRLAGQYAKLNDFKKVAEIAKEIESILMTKRGLEENAQNYAIWFEDGRHFNRKERFLHVKPIQPPRFVSRGLLKADKIILMSGTITPMDVTDLLGEVEYRYLDLASPIEASRRAVYYRPMAEKLSWQTDPAVIVKAIEEVITLNPGLNTIIHVSYSLSKKLAPHFKRPIIVNDTTDKEEKLEQFKKEGGVFLAAGCAEGIDLKGDLCRLNIIPKLAFPDLKDEVVKKRMKLPDGDEWYSLQTLKTTIQQVGRSTRTIDDYSKTYILDGQFGWRVRKLKDKLPKSFYESIIWARENK